jgi:hypothetical protein
VTIKNDSSNKRNISDVDHTKLFRSKQIPGRVILSVLTLRCLILTYDPDVKLKTNSFGNISPNKNVFKIKSSFERRSVQYSWG